MLAADRRWKKKVWVRNTRETGLFFLQSVVTWDAEYVTGVSGDLWGCWSVAWCVRGFIGRWECVRNGCAKLSHTSTSSQSLQLTMTHFYFPTTLDAFPIKLLHLKSFRLAPQKPQRLKNSADRCKTCEQPVQKQLAYVTVMCFTCGCNAAVLFQAISRFMACSFKTNQSTTTLAF